MCSGPLCVFNRNGHLAQLIRIIAYSDGNLVQVSLYSPPGERNHSPAQCEIELVELVQAQKLHERPQGKAVQYQRCDDIADGGRCDQVSDGRRNAIGRGGGKRKRDGHGATHATPPQNHLVSSLQRFGRADRAEGRHHCADDEAPRGQRGQEHDGNVDDILQREHVQCPWNVHRADDEDERRRPEVEVLPDIVEDFPRAG